MSDDDPEIQLSGGNVNEGVVRVGDTVRRATTKNSANVHRLLQHLETAGFSASPKILGVDDKGREILSFIAGSTDFPPDIWQDSRALIASGKMLRQYHDAAMSLPDQPIEGWAHAFADETRHEVICHNDFAPYNMVFRDGVPVGVFDFDLAGPGPKARDLAYLAYWMVPLSFAAPDMAPFGEAELAGGCSRLKLICGAYGTTDVRDVITLLSGVLHQMASREMVEKMVGPQAAERLETEGHLAHWAAEAAAYDARLPEILVVLDRDSET